MARPPAEQPGQALRCAPVDDSIPAEWPRDPVVCAAIAELDWPALLASRPGWHFDPTTGELLCVEQRLLTLTSVRPAEHAEGRTGIIFRRPAGGCEDCSSRPACLHSARPQAPKHAEFAVATAIAVQLRERLALVRGPAAGRVALEPVDSPPGKHAVMDSLFLPARARQSFRVAFDRATLRIQVEMPAPAPPPPHLIAVDVADRQCRRKTWAQNVDRYALPEATVVRVAVEGSDTLRRMLGDKQRHSGETKDVG